MGGRSYVKKPLRSLAILNIKYDDKYCFLWSILAYLHLCNKNHSNSVSNYKQNFNVINTEGFDFADGFKCSDVHKLEKLNISAINVFELNFYQDENKWRHKLIPIEVSKNDSDIVIDLLLYKIQYAPIKKKQMSF